MDYKSFWAIIFGFVATAALGLPGCGGGTDASVRATLSDGQVMYGSLRTATLSLEGGMGTLEIPLADVGEVVPVEGGELGESGGYVNVWLRNGSELAGKWHDPELTMGILVGGDEVKVDLPAGDLARMQTQGGEVWPDAAVYRVSTSHGDDFLVDAASSQLVLSNDLGTFSPFLSECRSARPLGDPDGEWRIELETGTVLVGELADDELTLALPMGPGEVTVPLAILVAMEQQDWYLAEREETRRMVVTEAEDSADSIFPARAPRDGAKRGSGWYPWGAGAGAGAGADAPAAEVAAEPAGVSMPETPAQDGDWFQRERLEATKQLAQ